MTSRPNRALAAVVSLVAALCAAIFWPAPTNAGPAILGEIQGQAAVEYADGRLAITAADRAILRWDHLAIASGAVVDITLPDPSSRVLIQVTGPRPADIAGRLVSNGHVYLIAPHGVEIHPGGVVRSSGLWISTSPVSEDAFSRGDAVESIGPPPPGARIVHAGAIESRRQASGRGGHRSVATIGAEVVLIGAHIAVRDGAVIDASGDLGGGEIAIGGGERGDDPRLANADVVSVAKGARILADATREGRGGDVVVWAEKLTTFMGTISSTGTGVNGNGGNAEVSSKGALVFDGHATLSSAAGRPGRLLIDPASITIQTAGPDIDGLGQGHDITSANELASTATYPSVNSIITAAALDGLLTAGVSMTLAASNVITVNAAVTASGPVTQLSLAAPTVNLNQPITLPFGGALAGTATTVNVGPSGGIQNGVDAAAAGATVTLAAATYVQEVKITKSLVLQGQGAANTSIVRPSVLTNAFVFAINGMTYRPIVLVEGAGPVTLQNLTVDGNPGLTFSNVSIFVGIGYHNASGTIQDVSVTRIEHLPPFDGAQSGFGIWGGIDDGLPRTINLLRNQIDKFQKGAVVMRGPTLTTVISNNTVTGKLPPGPPTAAAANGIVIQDSTTASISNNTLTNILRFTAGNNQVAIFLFGPGRDSSVTGNTIAGSNFGIHSTNAGASTPTLDGNLIISGNTVTGSTNQSIHVEQTNGLTTLTGNTVSCVPPSGFPTVNMDLVSTANRPFVLANNQFNGCDVGLRVQGAGATGPQVTMSHDAFVGTAVNYIQLVSAPHDIWPSTQTVSFDGLVSGQITQAQFDQLQTKIVDDHDDPALGLVLDFIAPTPRLSIEKAALPASFTVGVPGTYALTVTNIGVVPTTAVATASDDVPAGLILGALPAGCTAIGQQVSCSIAPGFAAQATATFLVPVTPTASGAVVNTARVSGGGDPGCPQETARCETTITTSITTPQLRVSKQATPASFIAGVAASYALAVVNEGTAATTAITTVTDSVAATLTLGAMPAGCTASAQQVTCTIPAGFAPGATATFVIPVTPAAGGSVVNTVSVSGGGDPGCPQATARCQATIATSITAPQLRVSKQATPASFVVVGAQASYTLAVVNEGTAATTAITSVVDSVPAALTVGAVPAGCIVNAQQVTCTIPSGLGPGVTATFVISVTPTVGGSVVNTARASGGGDPGCPQAAARCEATITTAITTPQLRVSKQATPASFAVGVAASYALTVINEGTAATTAITSVVDSVPAALTVGAVPTGCTVSSQQVTCTIPTGFAPGATTTFLIPVTPTGGESVVNTARVSGGGDPGCPQATARCEATITTSITTPQLHVTKQATPASFAVGVAASYALTVINEGTAATTAITTLTDTVPAALTVGAVPAGCTVSSQQVTCTIPAGFAPGATLTFVIPVTPTAPGALVNTARASGGGDQGCPQATARCEATITTAVAAPQLRLTKQATPASFAVGVGAGYTLTVINEGTAGTTANTTVTDNVAATLTLGAMPAGCTVNAHQVLCTIPAGFAPGATATFLIPVTPTASGVLVNTARMSGGGDQGCPQATARCEATITTAVAAPQLRLTKRATPASFRAGVAASYTLTVLNEGTAATTAATQVIDNVPATLTVGIVPAGCTVSSQQVTCTIPAGFAAGATATFILPVTPTVSGQSVTNAATIAGGNDAGCPGDTTRCASRVVTAVDAPQLRVTKEVQSPTFVPGQPASYRLTVTNEGTAATTQPVTLTDNVPQGLILGSLPGGCTATGQAVTCTVPPGLAAGASVSFTLPVVVSGTQPAGTVHNAVTISGGGDAGCPLEPRCRAQVGAQVDVVAPQPIPTTSPVMMLGIAMILLWLATARLRRRAGNRR